ncbi:magnesium transporter MRS2-5 [Phalaenopsis equestris]|uniref:magnesium transporter MRS2-5 n=1 Tax=Phalaenopsis equestris TaxID=78828 RepID=UPI0009E3E188|nr:magnesium transporter MRS2-5 [Phalaenopsis equestris]XP_020576670.1 magnesium transporter MRS2-5 [Phalaenopsis equestris]
MTKYYSALRESCISNPASHEENPKPDGSGNNFLQGFVASSMKIRSFNSRSWTQIHRSGKSQTLAFDKFTLMKRCQIPARDLRLLDPLFVYPSTILGREKAIVVSLEQIRCIIMADEVLLMNGLDNSVLYYESELRQRLQATKDQNNEQNNLPFEFVALELALELASASLESQVAELEFEMYPVLDELAVTISTINLERVRRLKSHLLALTHKVQKVRDEIENLMDDDDDMAEMYLTLKEERMEAFQSIGNPHSGNISKSAPVSPTCSSSIMSTIRNESSRSSLNDGSNVEELEMLLEAYFVVTDNTLAKLLSLKEYIDDTEDFINIKLDNIRNQLIQIELLLTAATFVVTIFAVVTGVFGMNFQSSVFDTPSNFNWILILSSVFCGFLYLSFLLYVKHKRLLPS